MHGETYAQILRRERENLLLSQEKLAEKIDCDARQVRDWESGHRFPGYKYRKKLCEFYGKSPQELGLAARPRLKGKSGPPVEYSYRCIAAVPPTTHARFIQQRSETVREIYARLIQPDITAIVITGIKGVGKSTLAALIAHYAEEQYRTGNGPFQTVPLWLRIDLTTTMADVIGTVCESVGKPLPALHQMSPQNQALALLHILDSVERPLLLILDQFELLLDWRTGQALEDRIGISEWVDAINSQPCRSRILLTSPPRPAGDYHSPAAYMQEHVDRGLKIEEGVDLLRKQEISGSEEEMRLVTTYCQGHAYALTLLAHFLQGRKLDLTTLLTDPHYSQYWMGNVARNFLHSIYQQQLNHMQQSLLFAFSLYREPVSLSFVQAIMDLSESAREQLEFDLDVLLRQRLLQAHGGSSYQIHAVVASYIQDRFAEDDGAGNHEVRLLAHFRAAQCYLQRSKKSCPPRALRRRISDAHDLIEAVWHLCHAERLREAYALLRREYLFSDLARWGGNLILLELLQLFLSLDGWQPERAQLAQIYNELGEVYNNLWQNKQAAYYCEQALQIYREIGDREGECHALARLGAIYTDATQNELALHYCEQALEVAQEVGDRREEGMVLGNLGWLHFYLGQKQQALEFFEQALSIHSSLGNREGESIALYGLGLMYSLLGESEKALDYYYQALALRRAIGDRRGEGYVLNSFGLLYRTLGRTRQALEYYEQALVISREVGGLGGEARNLNNIGQSYADLGESEQALTYYRQALAISREAEDRLAENWILTNRGKVYADLGQDEQAMNDYLPALRIAREAKDRDGEGSLLCHIGKLYASQKNFFVALAYLLLARDILKEVLNPRHAEAQEAIDALRKELGEKQFHTMLAYVEPRTAQIIEQVLLRHC